MRKVCNVHGCGDALFLKYKFKISQKMNIVRIMKRISGKYYRLLAHTIIEYAIYIHIF